MKLKIKNIWSYHNWGWKKFIYMRIGDWDYRTKKGLTFCLFGLLFTLYQYD